MKIKHSQYNYLSEYGIGDTLMEKRPTHYVEDCEVVDFYHKTLAHFTGFVYVWLDGTCAFRGTFKACKGFTFPDYFTPDLRAVLQSDDDSAPWYFVYN